MRAFMTLLAAAAVSLGACTANDLASTGAGAATPVDRGSFVAMAGASDLYETQSSQLALAKAQRADVRQFAQMMIDDHTKTTAQITAAAQASGLNPPPPQLMPMQADMIRELQQVSPTAFDSTYLNQQLTAHQMALALHTNYAAHGDTPALKSVAAAAAPIVRMHLDRVQQLKRTH